MKITQDVFVAAALVAVFTFTASASQLAFGQRPAQERKSFALLNFDEVGCRAKGRLQDRDYCRSEMMEQIIAQGKDAVPVLISQITDTREFTEPVFDFWNRMTVGDLANAILIDLFTDADWKTITLPGVEVLSRAYEYPTGAEAGWHAFVKKHGMKFVQDQWLAAWNANKDRVYWDTGARCFRISKKTVSK